MSTGAVPDTVVQRHLVRGGLYGLLLGIGAAIYTVLFSVIPFGDWVPLAIVIVAGVVVGLLWAGLAPAKKPSDWAARTAATTDPGIPDPGVPDPGTGGQGIPDPGTADPGIPDPGIPDPGSGGQQF
ncbi:MAG: hypothetical protein OEU32_17950 [Acidimicrobiia bacterium]|nr:hypothetical protein [Acidimicrobiia bacterium]